ncbi:hypothetical protein DFH09DRAFT_1119678, partial [Mycena vulgaris]
MLSCFRFVLSCCVLLSCQSCFPCVLSFSFVLSALVRCHWHSAPRLSLHTFAHHHKPWFFRTFSGLRSLFLNAFSLPAIPDLASTTFLRTSRKLPTILAPQPRSTRDLYPKM